MKYFVYTFDGKYYPCSESQIPLVERAMHTGELIRLQGDLIKGSALSRIEKASQNEAGPHLLAEPTAGGWIDEVLSLNPKTLSDGNHFWKTVVGINFIRHLRGIPWMFNTPIINARQKMNTSRAEDAMSYTEWSGVLPGQQD